jgi:Carboxypeptidase regulatory-like domain
MNCSAIRRNLLLCLMMLLAFGSEARPQTGTTSIVGEVSDPQGKLVTGGKVTVTDAASGVTRETTTDALGHYQFLALPPGTYSVRAEFQGFRSALTDKVEALVSVTQTVNIRLEIGSMSETVTVSGEAIAPINTVDATLGNAFDSKQILALPFEGRDAAAVLSLQPGVAYIPANTQNAGFDTRNGAVNGGRSDQANITLDGVDNNTQTQGLPFQGAVRSTLDSIEEFRVTTGGINADEGRSSGGQVTLVTKSGTNSYHGSAYIQDRSNIGLANEWFNKHTELLNDEPNVPGTLERKVYGAALGGPIKKDRLFFFGTYEASRQNESTTINRNVPGLTLRAGEVAYPNVNGTVTTLTSAQLKLIDPNCTGNGTCPLGNGPDPAAVAVFNQYPLPNSTSCPNNDGFNISCFTFSAAQPQHLNTSIAKLDYNLNRSGTHRLFLRGNYQDDAAAQAPEFPGDVPNTTQRTTSRALAAGYTAVLSSTLVNTFRYGFTRQSFSQQGLANQPLVSFRFIDDLVPQTSTNSFQIPVHNWVDDLSWTRGKHTLQFGTNVRLINNIRSDNASSFNNALINPLFLNTTPAGSGGSLDPAAFGFPAVDPGNSSVYNNAAIDLVGLISQATANYNLTKTGSTLGQGVPVNRHFRSWEFDWYAQDVWHVTPSLTLTAGLRYTILEPPYETTGTQVAPNFSLNQYITDRATAAEQGQSVNDIISFDLSGQANGKKPYWPYDYKDLGPRLAFAYAPHFTGNGILHAIFGDAGKSSLRGGFGIVYDHFGEGLVDTFDQNGAFGLTTSLTNAASIQTVDGGARFTALNSIPVSSPDGQLLAPSPGGSFPATPAVSTPSNPVQQIAFGLDDKLKTPYSELVDLAFTRELGGGVTLEVAYVGRFAHRLLEQRDLAQPADIKDPKSGMDYFTAASMFSKDFYAGTPIQNIKPIPFWEDLFPGATGQDISNPAVFGYCGAGTPPANPTATQSLYELFSCNIGPGTFGETNAINIFDTFCFPACAQLAGQPAGGRPFNFYSPQYTALYAWSTIGKSAYNALQATLRSPATHGVQFDFNYTFSKSLDSCSDAERVGTFGGLCAVINTFAPTQLRGPSDFDTRHLINSNAVIQLPFGRGHRFGNSWNRAVDWALGGWELVGLGHWSSGLPFSVGDGFTFPTNFQLTGNATEGPSRAGTGTSFLGPNGDPFAFKQGPGADTNPFNSTNPNFLFTLPGQSGARNNFRGAGIFDIDAGVNKSFRIREGVSLRLSAYAFNLTNSVNFDVVSISSSLTTPATFGQYSNTLGDARRFEFAARISF